MPKCDRSWTVYCHENKINGKRYFGITSQTVNERWRHGRGYKQCTYFYNAIQKYGWDSFKHNVLATGLDEETAKYLEKALIKEYKTRDENYGYNLTDGGDGTVGQVITEAMKEATRNACSKPVCQFDKKMNFIAEYRSALEAERVGGFAHNNISHCCLHPEGHYTYRGYIWLYKSDVPNIDKELYLNSLKHVRRTPIIQFTINMDFVKEYEGTQDAAHENDYCVSCINRCAANPYGGPYKNYIWMHKTDYERMLSGEIPMRQRYIHPHFKQVNQYTKDMQYLASYDSIKQAGEALNKNPQSILDCCKGRRKSAYGFIWRYKEECEEPSRER